MQDALRACDGVCARTRGGELFESIMESSAAVPALCHPWPTVITCQRGGDGPSTVPLRLLFDLSGILDPFLTQLEVRSMRNILHDPLDQIPTPTQIRVSLRENMLLTKIIDRSDIIQVYGKDWAGLVLIRFPSPVQGACCLDVPRTDLDRPGLLLVHVFQVRNATTTLSYLRPHPDEDDTASRSTLAVGSLEQEGRSSPMTWGPTLRRHHMVSRTLRRALITRSSRHCCCRPCRCWSCPLTQQPRLRCCTRRRPSSRRSSVKLRIFGR